MSVIFLLLGRAFCMLRIIDDFSGLTSFTKIYADIWKMTSCAPKSSFDEASLVEMASGKRKLIHTISIFWFHDWFHDTNAIIFRHTLCASYSTKDAWWFRFQIIYRVWINSGVCRLFPSSKLHIVLSLLFVFRLFVWQIMLQDQRNTVPLGQWNFCTAFELFRNQTFTVRTNKIRKLAENLDNWNISKIKIKETLRKESCEKDCARYENMVLRPWDSCLHILFLLFCLNENKIA